ncbi:hypothetical protein F5051DRAFT_433195 [Lentinula edodes]|nr:hypothetical protein F5051DRAFT_433195 [Lentinula edodes]
MSRTLRAFRKANSRFGYSDDEEDEDPEGMEEDIGYDEEHDEVYDGDNDNNEDDDGKSPRATKESLRASETARKKLEVTVKQAKRTQKVWEESMKVVLEEEVGLERQLKRTSQSPTHAFWPFRCPRQDSVSFFPLTAKLNSNRIITPSFTMEKAIIAPYSEERPSRVKSRQYRLLRAALAFSLLVACGYAGLFTAYTTPRGADTRVKVPINVHEIIRKCAHLNDIPGPHPSFGSRKESDRYVPETKPTWIKNATIWTGNNI